MAYAQQAGFSLSVVQNLGLRNLGSRAGEGVPLHGGLNSLSTRFVGLDAPALQQGWEGTAEWPC